MNEIKQEIISIRRSTDTVDGKVVSYLKTTPLDLGQDFSELVMSTLKKNWLPLVLLESGVQGEQLRQIGIWAISQLEAQITMIERICGINAAPPLQLPAQASSNPPLTLESINKLIGTEEDDEYEDDEDDEGCVEIKQLPETIMANRALGFID